MQSHIVLLALFAFFVSLVFALLSHDEPKAQLRFGALAHVHGTTAMPALIDAA